MAESDTLGLFYHFGIKLAVKLGRYEDALSWAEQALAIDRKCLGEDSLEYQAACDIKSSIDVDKMKLHDF